MRLTPSTPQAGLPALIQANPLTVCGLLFVALLVYSRATVLGPALALEARYTTGIVLLWAGLLIFAWQAYARSRRIVAASALLLGIACNVSSGPSGLRFHNGAWQYSVAIEACFRETGWRYAPECVDRTYPAFLNNRPAFDAVSEALYRERKAHFAGRP